MRDLWREEDLGVVPNKLGNGGVKTLPELSEAET